MKEPTPLEEALQTLREDAALLELALMGAEVAINELTFPCLFRLTDCLKQHIEDIAARYPTP